MKNIFFVMFFVFSALLLSIGLQAKTKIEVKDKPKTDVATVAQVEFKIARNVRAKFVETRKFCKVINSKVRSTNPNFYSKLSQIAGEVKNKGTNRQYYDYFYFFFGNFICR